MCVHIDRCANVRERDMLWVSVFARYICASEHSPHAINTLCSYKKTYRTFVKYSHVVQQFQKRGIVCMLSNEHGKKRKMFSFLYGRQCINDTNSVVCILKNVENMYLHIKTFFFCILPVFRENKLSGNPPPRWSLPVVGRVISWQQIGKWPFVEKC